jgi:transposase, IS6 family
LNTTMVESEFDARASGTDHPRIAKKSEVALDFLLSAKQDAAAAKRFLAKALGRQNHPVPRVINTDGHSAYPPAIVRLKAEGAENQTDPLPGFDTN